MEFNSIELHDALLKSMAIDFVGRSITIEVDYYQKEGDKDRTKGVIFFEEVDMANQISDFGAMKENAFAGNISYWSPSSDMGTTYIYLADGCIAISSNKVSFE